MSALPVRLTGWASQVASVALLKACRHRQARLYWRSGMPGLVPLKTKDGRFGYEAAGDPAHPPLAFLHGIGGAARAWRAQLEFFGGRYRAIAWDMPGYGGSAPLAAVSIASLADALHDFLQQVGAT